MAEYARNLIKALPDIEFIICTDLTDNGLMEGLGCDLIHLLYNPSVFHVTGVGIEKLSQSKKVVMTCFNGSDVSPYWKVHRMITHDPRVTGTNVTHIPLGIPDGWVKNGSPEDKVGIIGFPFVWKGMSKIAEAVSKIGMGLTAITPVHPWYRRNECLEEIANIRDKHPTADISASWMDFDAAMGKLRKCAVTCFVFQHDNGGGISSSVRYGLATGRPCVISQHDMYSDLFPYKDEIYISPRHGVEEIAFMLRVAEGQNIGPKRVLKDMSWKVCADKYRQVYNEVLN